MGFSAYVRMSHVGQDHGKTHPFRHSVLNERCNYCCSATLSQHSGDCGAAEPADEPLVTPLEGEGLDAEKMIFDEDYFDEDEEGERDEAEDAAMKQLMGAWPSLGSRVSFTACLEHVVTVAVRTSSVLRVCKSVQKASQRFVTSA